MRLPQNSWLKSFDQKLESMIIDPYRFGAPTVGGWKELGRHTLGSQGALDVSSLPDKRYYQVLIHALDSAPSANMRVHCNNDTGANHSARSTQNGTSDFTEVSKTNGAFWGNGVSPETFHVAHWANLSTKEKLGMCLTADNNLAGATNSPERSRTGMKWANTVDAIDQFNTNQSVWDTNSEMVVLGWDPDDVHTDNFWEPLAEVDLSGGAATSLSTGTFTAKKYLWIQYYTEKDGGGALQSILNVGNGSVVTTNDYAFRISHAGATDLTFTSQDTLGTGWTSLEKHFVNCFVINSASHEKLFIGDAVGREASGVATAPDRLEFVGKLDSSNQIDIITLAEEDGFTLDPNTILRVYGAD